LRIFKPLQLYSASILASSLICLAYLLAIPGRWNNQGFLGLSTGRLLPALAIFIVAVISSGYLIWVYRNRKKEIIHQQRVSRFLSSQWTYAFTLFLLASFVLIFSWIIVSSVRISYLADNPFVIRLRPLIGWAAAISLFTLFFAISSNAKANRNLSNWLLGLPPVTWTVIGCLVSFAIFYLPIYLFQIGKLDFPDFVPSSEPVGDDLRRILDLSTANIINGSLVPKYQPFPLVFFLPLTFLGLRTAYQLVVLTTFLCYLFIAFIYPHLILKTSRNLHISSLVLAGDALLPLTILVGGIGLFSYGLGFEFENGQFNLITFAITIVAVYIFHYCPKQRFLSYFLMTIAIQLKLWPAIFILMLIDNWSEWEINLRRFIGLLAVNIIAFLVLGWRYLMGFIEFFINSRSTFLWEGNTSVDSFLSIWSAKSQWIASNFNLLNLLFLALILACILTIVFQSWRKQTKGFNPYLFLACAIGAMLIPSFSYDFKLPILTAPFILFSANFTKAEKLPNRSILFSLLLLISVAYSSTNFSYVVKSPLFQNNFPALLLMLVLVTVSFFLIEAKKDKKVAKPVS
jgi:hypothetical protein